MRRARLVRRLVTPLTLVAILSACHSWVEIRVGPQMPDPVRVARRPAGDTTCPREPSRFQVWSPAIVRDTLTGRLDRSSDEVYRIVPVAEICSLQKKVFDWDTTFYFGIMPAIIGVGILVAIAQGCFSGNC